MKIGLIGAGRLGICLALLIEKAGYEVLASDNREDYVRDLQKGIHSKQKSNKASQQKSFLEIPTAR